MPTKNPNETALRLVLSELKSMRAELRGTRKTLGGMSATLVELGSHVKGMQVALGERERDFQAKHDEFGQRLQAAHERVSGIVERVARTERALRLRPA